MIQSRYGKLAACNGFRRMPRKMTGRAMMRLVPFMVASSMPIVVAPRHLRCLPRALGRERLEQGHSSFERRAVRLAEGTHVPREPGVAEAGAPFEKFRACRHGHELHAPAVRRVHPPCDEAGKLQLVGKARRSRGRQAFDLGETADTERAVADHGGECG